MIGRPPVTTHADIEAAAFKLFAQKGFAATTLEDIAQAVGVGRRTIFRYYPSKNDIPWGRFDESLAGFRETLQRMPAELPVFDAVHQGVIEFNRFDDAVLSQHRERMSLILRTPELQAHSALRYEQWRQVIADYVARRTGHQAASSLPATAGHVGLALALSAYESWLSDENDSLTESLSRSFSELGTLMGRHG